MEITISIPDNYELIQDGDFYLFKKKYESVPNQPKSWKEYCKNYPVDKQNEFFISNDSIISRTDVYKTTRMDVNDRNLISSIEEAEAFLSLIQLRRLREAWVGDFKPNYEKENYFAICSNEKGDVSVNTVYFPRVIVFPSKEMADEFLSCFNDLIKKAKMLL